MNKKHFIAILFVILSILVATGCANSTDNPIFVWDEIRYIMTYEPISKDKLEKEIGSITKEVKKQPSSDGEAYKLGTGTKLFKIKNEAINGEGYTGILAVEVKDKYYIARKIIK